MRILITGAAGKVGTALRKRLAKAGHELRLVDVKPIQDPEGESFALDISNGNAVRRAMEGIDAVAHLAYGKHNYRKPLVHIARSFDVNAKGTYNLLWAALDAHVKRFVYTSTLSVFGTSNDLGRRFLTERTKPYPREAYGLTKFAGEEACRLFADRWKLSVVCLRLCNVVLGPDWPKMQEFRSRKRKLRCWRAMATHAADVARAIHLALTKPGIRFELLHICGDNPGRITSIQRAKQVLGFWPKYKLDP